jgi:hypothetical protein
MQRSPTHTAPTLARPLVNASAYARAEYRLAYAAWCAVQGLSIPCSAREVAASARLMTGQRMAAYCACDDCRAQTDRRSVRQPTMDVSEPTGEDGYIYYPRTYHTAGIARALKYRESDAQGERVGLILDPDPEITALTARGIPTDYVLAERAAIADQVRAANRAYTATIGANWPRGIALDALSLPTGRVDADKWIACRACAPNRCTCDYPLSADADIVARALAQYPDATGGRVRDPDAENALEDFESEDLRAPSDIRASVHKSLLDAGIRLTREAASASGSAIDGRTFSAHWKRTTRGYEACISGVTMADARSATRTRSVDVRLVLTARRVGGARTSSAIASAEMVLGDLVWGDCLVTQNRPARTQGHASRANTKRAYRLTAYQGKTRSVLASAIIPPEFGDAIRGNVDGPRTRRSRSIWTVMALLFAWQSRSLQRAYHDAISALADIDRGLGYDVADARAIVDAIPITTPTWGNVDSMPLPRGQRRH